MTLIARFATLLPAVLIAVAWFAGPVQPAGARIAPRHGALLGIYVKPRQGRTHGQEIRHVERQIGRRFAIDHFYEHFGDGLASRAVRATVSRGRIPLINWSPETGRGIISWGRIAAGGVDRTINRAARALRGLRRPVMLAFHHEPENDTPRFGTAAQYRAAFRHIVHRFRVEGARNVRFVCILEAYTYDGGNGGARRWYPGRRYVGWAGADGYNWAPGRAGYAWRSFRDIFSGFNRWGAAHGRPLIVSEFGAQELPGDTAAKADWITSAARTVRGWPHIKAVVYFNSDMSYPWWIDTSPRSLVAFRALAQSRYFRP